MKDVDILQYVANDDMIYFLLGDYNFVRLNLLTMCDLIWWKTFDGKKN